MADEAKAEAEARKERLAKIKAKMAAKKAERRAENKEKLLKNLRERRHLDPHRLTGASAPKTAFVIMGHGEELSDMKVVPPGCILVVEVHSGELNYLTDTFFTNIFNDPNNENWLDPVKNYKYITDFVKKNSPLNKKPSLAIYREGDIYPDFKYHLLSYWDSIGKNNTFNLKDSGIAKYPFTKGKSTKMIVEYTEKDKGEFISLYDKSMYPPNDILNQEIEEFKKAEFLDFVEADTFLNIMEGVRDPTDITRIKQSEIFDKVEKREDGFEPGVFYNFVCRATTDKILVKNDFNRLIINNNKRALVNSEGHIIRNKKEILGGIHEAMFHRGNLVPKLNLNKPVNMREILDTIYYEPSKKIEIFKKYNRELRAIFLKKLKEMRVYKDAESDNKQAVEYADFYIKQYEEYIEELDKIQSKSAGELNLNNTAGFPARAAVAEANAAAKVAAWRHKGGRTYRRSRATNRTRRRS